jgi:hypothetical protein
MVMVQQPRPHTKFPKVFQCERGVGEVGQLHPIPAKRAQGVLQMAQTRDTNARWGRLY